MDRRSLLLQKQQTSTTLNEALSHRPDREQLEQKHILAPSTSSGPSAASPVTPHKPVRCPFSLSLYYKFHTESLCLSIYLSVFLCQFYMSYFKSQTYAMPPQSASRREDPNKKKGIGGIFGFGKKKEPGASSPAPSPRTPYHTLPADIKSLYLSHLFSVISCNLFSLSLHFVLLSRLSTLLIFPQTRTRPPP